jgi:hypothetical protein
MGSRIYIFLLLGALSGCGGGAEKGIIHSWLGSDINEVASQWGPPQSKREILGRQYFIWESSPAHTSGTAITEGNKVYYSTSGGGSSSWNCTRFLEVDNKNTIISGYSQGNNCCVMAVAGQCASLLKTR